MIERQKNSKVIYNGKVLTLRVDDIELENGSKSVREIVENSGGATIVAVTDDNKICLIKQFRYAIGDYIIELPAGKMSIGEDPLDCAKRELTEETGYIAEDVSFLLKINPSPAYLTEIIYIYLATKLTKGQTNFDEDEDIFTFEVTLSEALDMIAKGKITDGKTIIGLLYYAQNYRGTDIS